MATTDKQRVEQLKNGGSNSNGTSKKSSNRDNAKQGANRIVDFINDVSDKASDQVADAITAATVQKAMGKLGIGDGPMTQAAIASFENAFTEVLIEQLPELTGATDDPKYFLPSALPLDSEPTEVN